MHSFRQRWLVKSQQRSFSAVHERSPTWFNYLKSWAHWPPGLFSYWNELTAVGWTMRSRLVLEKISAKVSRHSKTSLGGCEHFTLRTHSAEARRLSFRLMCGLFRHAVASRCVSRPVWSNWGCEIGQSTHSWLR